VSSFLYSLGRRAFAARKTVVVLWLLVLALTGGGALAFNGGLSNNVTIPGTESQSALDRLSVTFPQVSGAAAQVVAVAPHGVDVHDPAVAGPVDDAVEQLKAMPQVAAAMSPYDQRLGGLTSHDGTSGLINVQFKVPNTLVSQDSKDQMARITHDLQDRLPPGSQATYGGQLFSQKIPGVSVTEGLGVVVAVVVLTITLGSFLAAGMPLAVALTGVGISTALIFLASAVTEITSTSPLLALMLGLAVGIDYALFIVSRHQQELADGREPQEAAGRSVATAGSAVIFAGITVMIALLGLSVVGIPFLTTMGVAATFAVGIAVLVAVTLVPALLGFARKRLRPRRRAKRSTKVGAGDRFFSGWVRAATRFPAATVAAVIALLGALSIPAAGLQLSLPDAGALPEDDPARVNYDTISEHFGPGFNGPLIVTGSIVTSTDPLGLMNGLKDEISRMPGVAAVPMATPNPTADTGILQVIPQGSADSEQTKNLVQELRGRHDYFQHKYGVDLKVTGATAVGVDVSEKLGSALLPFGLVVVGLSLVLLTMVFRSVTVPLKAALGYLLSIGSSLGIVALVFQDGYLADWLGLSHVGPVISFMPVVLMGILFGLAMDYEVFLVSRMREEYARTGDARGSVRTGFVSSSKVVTAAAVIMLSVFAAFVPEGDANLKPIAFGLAVGVFVDAFLVRMTLVPAVMAMLGDRAWWIPRWLAKSLPALDVEGEGLQHEVELASFGGSAQIAGEGLRLDDPSTGRPLYRDVALTVHTGTTHLVRGQRQSQVSALLLTLAGRLKPDSGRLKVCGLVLPTRAAAVRSRAAYVSDPGSLDEVLRERPEVLVLDGLHQLDEDELDAVRRRIAEHRRERSLTVVAGTTGADDEPLAPVQSSTDLRDAAAGQLTGATR
jgi:RND superfamily putative drug exporter